jgi:hypothetical protein
MFLPEGRSFDLSRQLLQGAIDIHVHAGPHIFSSPRRVDPVEAAAQARDAGMRAIVFMDVFEMSNGTACRSRGTGAPVGHAAAHNIREKSVCVRKSRSRPSLCSLHCQSRHPGNLAGRPLDAPVEVRCCRMRDVPHYLQGKSTLGESPGWQERRSPIKYKPPGKPPRLRDLQAYPSVSGYFRNSSSWVAGTGPFLRQ